MVGSYQIKRIGRPWSAPIFTKRRQIDGEVFFKTPGSPRSERSAAA